MPRKRKVATVVEDPITPPPTPLRAVPRKQQPNGKAKAAPLAANKSQRKNTTQKSQQTLSPIRERHAKRNPMFEIFEKAQKNESLHGKYIKELIHLCNHMEQPVFMSTFLRGLRIWMRFDESNTFANIGLSFMAKFLTSFNEDDETHPVLVKTFEFLLSTVSPVTIIRFRLVQFVNLILGSMQADAALDESICNNIMKYMTDRLKDYTSSVRVQAVQALQRLQVPENPDDSIVRLYLFHLANDTSAKVRQAVITAIGRNYHTVPSIMERLWDVDERVRRHTYLQMSSYPVKAYKVVQRLTFLEQGLNDHAEAVRKVVTGVLLPQWVQSYNKQYIAFVSALKLDANEEEIQRFTKIAMKALSEIFKTQRNVEELIEALPLATEGEFERCVPFNKLTVECIVYWWSLVEHLQTIDGEEDFSHDAICELSTFCQYVSAFCKYKSDITDQDRWAIQENQYKFLLLVEILLTFDLADEIGRQNLKKSISELLMTEIVEENLVKKLVRCVESLLPDQDTRLQYFVDIVRGVIDPKASIDFSDKAVVTLIDSIKDPNAKVKISTLKLKILDLREQESNAYQEKNYAMIEKISEDLLACNEDFIRMLNKFITTNKANDGGALDPNAALLASFQPKKLSMESIQQCLQICFYAVASRQTNKLTPNMCKLYQDFIRRQMESKQMILRDWALKCGTSFSMLYEQLAKDVYNELNVQFYRHQSQRIWTTSISALFELIDRFGFDYFEIEPASGGDESEKQTDKSKKTHRQLYNKMGSIDEDEEESSKSSLDLMYLFGHFLETLNEVDITKALIIGFCRLVLSGHYTSEDLVSKLLLRFFNPATDPEINQILGIFFNALCNRRRQECLHKALMQALFVILESPNDTPLKEIKADHIIKFVIESTIPACSPPGVNIHNEIALSFVKMMNEQHTNKDLLKLLSKEMLTLQISDDALIRNELKQSTETLVDRVIDPKILGCLKNFQELLAGTYKAPEQRPAAGAAGLDDPRDIEEVPTDEEDNGTHDGGSTAGDRASTAGGTGEAPTSDAEYDEDGDESEAGLSSIYPSQPDTLPSQSISSIFPSQPERILTSTVIGSQAKVLSPKEAAPKPAENTGPGRKKLSRERQPATSSEEDESMSKARKTAAGRKPIKDNKAKNNKEKGGKGKNSASKSDTEKEDDEEEPSDDASKENILEDSAEISNIGEQTTIQRTPDAPSVQEIRAKKHYTTKDLIQSPKTPPEPPQKPKRKLVESNVMVRLKKLSRQSIERQIAGSYLLTPHRTRNALVAEFKKTNVMTRNRLAVDQIKSPTRRVEHLKKVTSVLNKTTIELPSPVLLESPRRKTMPARNENSKRGTPRSTPKTTPNVSPSRSAASTTTATRSPTANRSLANASPASATRSPIRRQLTPTDTTKIGARDADPKRNKNENNANSLQTARGNNTRAKTNNNNKTPPSPAKENKRGRPKLNSNTADSSIRQSQAAAATATVSRRRNNQALSVSMIAEKTTVTSARPSRHSEQSNMDRPSAISTRPTRHSEQPKTSGQRGGGNQPKITNLTSKKNETAPVTQVPRATRGSKVGGSQPEIRTSSRTRASATEKASKR